jgi:hypothetical protein
LSDRNTISAADGKTRSFAIFGSDRTLGKLVETVLKFAVFDLAFDDRGAKAVNDFAWGFARETFIGEALLF